VTAAFQVVLFDDDQMRRAGPDLLETTRATIGLPFLS
jgi:hypothetical protein